MQLIKETNRRIVTAKDYNGVCHYCNSPITYDGELYLIELEETDEYWRVVPIDVLSCPHCFKSMMVMKIYKSTNIEKEFAEIEKKENE